MADFFNLILTHTPWFWLAVMIVSIIIEAATFSLTTVWAAISAFLMVFLCQTPLPFLWQVLVFFLITIVLLLFTRPFAVKRLRIGTVTTNVNTLEGQEVLITKKITQFEKGEAKASNGVIWTATSDGEGEIPKGTVCVVSRVEGNTLVIEKNKKEKTI